MSGTLNLESARTGGERESCHVSCRRVRWLLMLAASVLCVAARRVRRCHAAVRSASIEDPLDMQLLEFGSR